MKKLTKYFSLVCIILFFGGAGIYAHSEPKGIGALTEIFHSSEICLHISAAENESGLPRFVIAGTEREQYKIFAEEAREGSNGSVSSKKYTETSNFFNAFFAITARELCAAKKSLSSGKHLQCYATSLYIIHQVMRI